MAIVPVRGRRTRIVCEAKGATRMSAVKRGQCHLLFFRSTRIAVRRKESISRTKARHSSPNIKLPDGRRGNPIFRLPPKPHNSTVISFPDLIPTDGIIALAIQPPQMKLSLTLSLLKKATTSRQKGYKGVWAKPTPPYISFPFSLLGFFQCIQLWILKDIIRSILLIPAFLEDLPKTVIPSTCLAIIHLCLSCPTERFMLDCLRLDWQILLCGRSQDDRENPVYRRRHRHP